MLLAFAFILAALLVLTVRIGWIQVVASDKYMARAAEGRIKDEIVAPDRGSILDRNGRELAVSTTKYEIWIRTLPEAAELKANGQAWFDGQVDIAVRAVSRSTGIGEDEILAMLDDGHKRVKVIKKTDKETMSAIKASAKEQNGDKRVPVIEVVEISSRSYPLGSLASNVIGGVNSAGNGQSGVELSFDSDLSGITGRSIASTDRDGNKVTGGELASYASKDGLSVVLTIDETLQYYTEQALAEGLAATQADRMMAIVMDPSTGDVLAMATTDNFDPNNPLVPITEEDQATLATLEGEEYSKYLNEMWKNPLVSDVYDPGSVFKLITVSSAIETGSIKPEDHFYCSGALEVYDRLIRCWEYPKAHGSQTVAQAVQNSCNPAMIQIVQKMGFDNYYRYLELYGFKEKTNIDLPGETNSLMLKVQCPVGLATMSFGQGISVTPLQMITAVCAIANDGKLMQPRIALSLNDSEGNVVYTYPTKIKRQVLSEETSAEVRSIMQYVADSDKSASKAGHIEGYKIGMKTGTTQKLVDGTYDSGQTIATTVIVAPIENPKFVILIIADNPKTTPYGISAAGPTANKIAREALRYLNVKPSYTDDELQALSKKEKTVPDVTGKSYSEAAAVLEAAGFTAASQGDGTDPDFAVVDQYPKPGTKTTQGSSVFLYRN
jgi:stage V sporulation protein D (sporulation-specific penicillin-binding protein)